MKTICTLLNNIDDVLICFWSHLQPHVSLFQIFHEASASEKQIQVSQ